MAGFDRQRAFFGALKNVQNQMNVFDFSYVKRIMMFNEQIGEAQLLHNLRFQIWEDLIDED